MAGLAHSFTARQEYIFSLSASSGMSVSRCRASRGDSRCAKRGSRRIVFTSIEQRSASRPPPSHDQRRVFRPNVWESHVLPDKL
jgi:hypothetical protein